MAAVVMVATIMAVRFDLLTHFVLQLIHYCLDTGGWGNDNTAAASGGWDTAATDDQWGGNASATTGW